MAASTRSSNNISPSMALHSTVDPSLFPLRSINDVVGLFKRSMELYHAQGIEPDLTLLSIVAGYIELSLTTGDAAQAAAATAAEHASQMAAAATAAAAAAAAASASTSSSSTSSMSNQASTTSALKAAAAHSASSSSAPDVIAGNCVPFPVITYELVSGLYKKFQSILSIVDKPKVSSNCNSRQASRDVIKKVSDVIWHSLIRSTYKDRAHLQNLYSYLSGNKLDCFGVALAVVAGCQLLGYRNVRLAISEDHAWVVFGNKRLETIEVTWHGKGSEDKRGLDISPGIESGSWLYLGGMAVVCDKPMEVVAIVSAINISLSSNSDCVEVSDLQQRLLWLLYDLGHLRKYPMALGTLGELEEVNPTRDRQSCEKLYREAIESARVHYRNHHVYPYTYQGNYYNRLNRYREAFAAWANAADVIRLYTYQCRDDEEVYKELLDIANEMIPFVMKTESSGHSARSILRDSEVFANLLRFYDGICQWEEDSLTPILHIGWAKPLVNNICKFDYDVRSQLVIKVPEETSSVSRNNDQHQHHHHQSQSQSTVTEKEKEKEKSIGKHSDDVDQENLTTTNNNNNNGCSTARKEDKCVVVDQKRSSEMAAAAAPTLADLTAACGEKLLNPDFLLQGGGQPFAEQQRLSPSNASNSTTTTNGSGRRLNGEGEKQPQAEGHSNNSKTTQEESPPPANASPSSPLEEDEDDDPRKFMLKHPVITLYSQKMKGLKDLLLAEKLNTHAISLQVTAQSVASKKIRGIDKNSGHGSGTTGGGNGTGSGGGGGGAGGAGGAGGSGADTGSSNTGSESIASSRPKRSRRE